MVNIGPNSTLPTSPPIVVLQYNVHVEQNTFFDVVHQHVYFMFTFLSDFFIGYNEKMITYKMWTYYGSLNFILFPSGKQLEKKKSLPGLLSSTFS